MDALPRKKRTRLVQAHVDADLHLELKRECRRRGISLKAALEFSLREFVKAAKAELD